MMFVYGVVGFFGFEALRIYKRIWAKKSIVPLGMVWLYLACLLILAAMAAAVANALSDGRAGLAIYLGFSLPTSAKTIFEQPLRRGSEDSVDDIEIRAESPGARSGIADYFRF
jgi:hypothetical protein